MVLATNDHFDEVASFVERFEHSRQESDAVDFVHFLPDATHPAYAEIATELIRVDMEYSWESGRGRTVSDYRRELPDLLAVREVLESVAYEEYRLRAQSGCPLPPQHFATEYKISTGHWRSLENGRAEISHDAEARGVPEREEIQLLSENTAEFPACGLGFLSFHLEREIGRGAFARVYLARQSDLARRHVVLKLVGGRTLEPQHLARLQHTNVVPIYSVHQAEGLTAVCMPYFGERTLADVIHGLAGRNKLPRSGQALLSTVVARKDDTVVPLDSKFEAPVQNADAAPNAYDDGFHAIPAEYVEAVMWVVLQIAEGLAHAHQRGIVHRDLKPANVLLTDEGVPLILDFNLSSDVVVHGRASLMVGGTLPYMAPEHLRAVLQGGQVDFCCDIYSLGAMFFELLTGRRPFPDRRGVFEEIAREMIRDRSDALPAVRSVNPGVPRAVEAIVHKCLAAKARQRYQTSAELCEDLRRQLQNRPLKYAADKSLKERAIKWARRHPRASSGTLITSIAAVLLVLLSAVSVRWWAVGRFREFQTELPLARAALSVPDSDPDLLVPGMKTVQDALDEYGVRSKPDWGEWLARAGLPTEDRVRLDEACGELLYQLASAKVRTIPEDDAVLQDALHLNELACTRFAKNRLPRALYLQRASLLQQAGEDEQAENSRRLATQAETRSTLDMALRAQQLLEERQYELAMPLLNCLRDDNPADGVYWLLMGHALVGLDRLQEAESCYSTAAALLPESIYPRLFRGMSRMDQQRYEDALADYDHVLRLHPQQPCCLLNRALAHAEMGNHEQAIIDFTKALDQGASQTRIYFLRARSYQAIGEGAAAEQDIARGLQETPTDERSWGARGICRLPADPAGALEDFQHALQINPRSMMALRNIVHVTADRLNRPETALQALNRMLEINPHDTFALAGRAVLEARQGNRAAAIADVQQLLRLSKQPTHLFQAACALSLTAAQHAADASRGTTMLSKAVLQEPSLWARAKTDPDLQYLRGTDGFKQLAATMDPGE